MIMYGTQISFITETLNTFLNANSGDLYGTFYTRNESTRLPSLT